MSELDAIKTQMIQLGQNERTWSPGFNSLFDLCNRAIAIAKECEERTELGDKLYEFFVEKGVFNTDGTCTDIHIYGEVIHLWDEVERFKRLMPKPQTR